MPSETAKQEHERWKQVCSLFDKVLSLLSKGEDETSRKMLEHIKPWRTTALEAQHEAWEIHKAKGEVDS